MPISSSLTPCAVTTCWEPPTPTDSPAGTSTRAHSCGLATEHCWLPRTKSFTSRVNGVRGECSPADRNRAAMTGHANEVIADDSAGTLLAIESIKQLKGPLRDRRRVGTDGSSRAGYLPESTLALGLWHVDV